MKTHTKNLFLLLALICAVPTAAQAASIIVTNNADSRVGTLRAALASAANGDISGLQQFFRPSSP